MGAALVTLIFYSVQFIKDGELVLLVPSVFKEIASFRKAKEEDLPPKLSALLDSLESLVYVMRWRSFFLVARRGGLDSFFQRREDLCPEIQGPNCTGICKYIVRV